MNLESRSVTKSDLEALQRARNREIIPAAKTRIPCKFCGFRFAFNRSTPNRIICFSLECERERRRTNARELKRKKVACERLRNQPC